MSSKGQNDQHTKYKNPRSIKAIMPPNNYNADSPNSLISNRYNDENSFYSSLPNDFDIDILTIEKLVKDADNMIFDKK